MWEATALVRHKTKLATLGDVEAALDAILTEVESSEVTRRVKAKFEPQIFRLSDPIEDAEKQIEAFTGTLRKAFSSAGIAAIQAAENAAVSRIKETRKRREFFHGKRVLQEFYKRHMHKTGMSKEIFVYACARVARERKSVKEFVSKLMLSLGLAPIAEPKATEVTKESAQS